MESLSAAQFLYCAVVLILSYAIRGSAGFGGVTVPLLALGALLLPQYRLFGARRSHSSNPRLDRSGRSKAWLQW